MSVILTPVEYAAACSYTGTWFAGERWGFTDVGETTGEARGVYLLTTPCTCSGRPRVVYVGKANRAGPDGDVAKRLDDHRRSSNGPLIRWVTIIPVIEETPAGELLRIEGDVARYFGVPRLCRAVPGGRSRRG